MFNKLQLKKNLGLIVMLGVVVSLIIVSFAVIDFIKTPEHKPYNPNNQTAIDNNNSINNGGNDWSGWGETVTENGEVDSASWFDINEAVKYDMKTETKKGTQSNQMADNLITKFKNKTAIEGNNEDTNVDNNNNIDIGYGNIGGDNGYGNGGDDYQGNNGVGSYPQGGNENNEYEGGGNYNENEVDTSTLGIAIVNNAPNSEFDLTKFVNKQTTVIYNNKEDKIFNSLRNLENEFVVVLQRGESFQQFLDSITKEFNDRLLIDSLTYGKVSPSDNNHYLVKVDYLITKEELAKVKIYAKDFADKVKNLKDKEKITNLNLEISSKYSYSENGSNIYSPYELYNNRKGVCQAYTSLAKIMLDEMGIKNGIATGSLKGELHTWNVVVIDGQELHIDFTLNDTQGEKYTLKTLQQISSDRKVTEIIF